MKNDFETKLSNVVCSNASIDFPYLEGYASIFDVVDNHNDKVIKGAFEESISRHSNVQGIKLLWQHEATEPLGKIEDIFEDTKGLYIKAQINTNLQRGREVVELVKQGVINGLSIGFQVKEFEYENTGVRILKKINLWEVSIVTFPANGEALISSFKNNAISKMLYICNQALETIKKINKEIR